MKKKIVWLVVSCLMVAALVLASCGPAVTEEEEEIAPPTPEEEEAAPAVEEEVVPAAEGPRYGGIFRYPAVPIIGFDEAFTNPWTLYTLYFTNEELLTGDITKGAGGTGEASWLSDEFFIDLETGLLAESWEIADDQTLIYHLRKGVRFHDKPPTSGRELVADDVVFSINRLLDGPRSFLSNYVTAEERPTITAPDKYTVVIKLPPEWPSARMGEMLRLGDFCYIVPRDMVEEHEDLQKWENSCGTGPFMMVDYISGSSATFDRNPIYWRKDPRYPENTLPYLDGIKMLFIEDASTVLAAFRTGKIDYILDVGWEDWEDLMKSNPEMQYLEHLRNYSWNIFMRADLEDIPLGDVRVRQALSMALDRQAIIDEFYGGHANALTYPLAPVQEFLPMYTPIEELPEEVRELYEYHPDKARELLAEAGYPDGFKTEIILYTGLADQCAIIEDYWSKIGVDVELVTKEWGVYSSLAFGTKEVDGERIPRYDEMVHRYAGTNISVGFLAIYTQSTSQYPEFVEHYDQLMLNQMDAAKVAQLWQEFNPWLFGQMFWIEFPTPTVWTMWQPWVKGYHGERGIGHCNASNAPIYAWMDQDLKEEMTGSR